MPVHAYGGDAAPPSLASDERVALELQATFRREDATRACQVEADERFARAESERESVLRDAGAGGGGAAAAAGA